MIGLSTFPIFIFYFTPTRIHVANHRYATIGDTPPTNLWFVLKHLMSITATIFNLFQPSLQQTIRWNIFIISITNSLLLEQDGDLGYPPPTPCFTKPATVDVNKQVPQDPCPRIVVSIRIHHCQPAHFFFFPFFAYTTQYSTVPGTQYVHSLQYTNYSTIFAPV